MGENQSKPQKPSSNPRSQNNYRPPSAIGSANNNPQQQQEDPNALSQEEIRRKRLARMEKDEYVPRKSPLVDDANHPVTKEFGINAYQIHKIIEDLLLNTYHPSSLSRNPSLRLLQPANPDERIRLYTFENVDQVILKIIKIETYYPGETKFTYLIDLHQRLSAIGQQNYMSVDKTQELQKKILKSLMDYLASASTYNPKTQEDPKVISDLSNPVFQVLYKRISELRTDKFFYEFLQNLSEEHFEGVVTPIIKRIICDSSDNSIPGRLKILQAMNLFQDILHCNNKIAEFILNHELFIPKSPNPTGQDYQRNTLFGCFLTFTFMNNDHQSIHESIPILHMANWEAAKVTKNAMREKIHEPINALHKLIEFLIKLNPKYKKNIIDWFHGVVSANKPMEEGQKRLADNGDKLSTHGWFCNFTVLLLKLCQKMLQDPSSYPNWITKVDLSYAYNKPIFENQQLFNGEYIQKPDPNTENNFSFLTELIFTTTYAWYLMGDAVKTYKKILFSLGLKGLTKTVLKDAETFKNSFQETRQIFVGDTQLLDPYIMDQMYRLLNFQILLILKNKDQANNNNSQQSILKFWGSNVIIYIQLFTTLNSKLLSGEFSNLTFLMNFIFGLLNNNFQTNQTDLREKCVKLLLKLSAYFKLGHLDQQFIFLFRDNPFAQNNLIEGLISLYVGTKSLTFPSEEATLKTHPSRSSSVGVVNYLLESVFASNPTGSYLMTGLKQFMVDSPRYYEFLDLFMDDMIVLVDQLFAKLAIKPENSAPSATEIAKIAEALRNCYCFAVNITKSCPEFFLNESIRARLAMCLNYSMKIFNGEGETHVLKLTGVGEQLTLEFFLVNLVKIYLNLASNDEFMRCVIVDENYRLGYFYQTLAKFDGNELLTGSNKDNFSQMIATLELLDPKIVNNNNSE